ncbi:PIN-like domain-containing protein [Paenibacillus sp. FSL H8-0317]|uniref:PIN-like domain-containing protein n=1 Tax=Paenibacillus sp. FSL H8-0317 TaxID=2921385 RepID=UPI003255FEED
MSYLSEQDFRRLWKSALISVDTSALLFLQECNSPLSKYAMDTLLFIEDRIWIPSHVANVEMDPQLNYTGEITGSIRSLNNFDREFDKTISAIDEKFQSLHKKLDEQGHELLSDLIAEIDINKVLYDAISKFKLNVALSTEENKDFLQSKLVQVFQKSLCSRTSTGFTDEEVSDIEQEGIIRYENSIPPGYSDRNKATNKFGDLIIWKELLKKSNEEKKPILFITRDKKEDWFKLTDNKIVEVREELRKEMEANNAEVFVIYFNDFIKMSLEFVSRNFEELQEKVDNQEYELAEQIEIYINENMHGEIEEKLTNIESIEYNSDFIAVDVVEDIEINNYINDIDDEIVIINCKVNFTVYVDHNYYVGSREPNIELPSVIKCQVDARVYIEIFSGTHNDQIKLIDIDSPYIELDEVEVISSTDPLGHDEDYDDAFQEDTEPYEDQERTDELEAEFERNKEQKESAFANEEHISVEEIEADLEERIRQKEAQDDYEERLREEEE